MNFKPTKWKVILSIVVVLIWYFLSSQLFAIGCGELLCEPCSDNLQGMSLYYSNCCGCYSNFQIYQDFLLLILVGALVYVIWSLLEKNKQ